MTTPKKKVLLKIIILGDSAVGKTAILQKFVSGQFIEQHKATIGADFSTKEIAVDDKLVTLQMWDTAGQERFASLGHAFYRGADACILVYDITNEQSFKNIEQWRNNFLDNAAPDDPKTFPFLLLGNKSDLQDQRAVQPADGQRLANTYTMEFRETSALTGNNIEPAIRAIATTAAARDTAPIFSEDVMEQLDRGKKVDLAHPEPAQSQACPCSLI
jgi:Ras-related protein Rab-7A